MVQADDGEWLDIASLPKIYNYIGDDLNYIEVSKRGKTYRQTFTSVSGKVAASSKWIKQ